MTSPASPTEATIRAVNARVARSYDELPYEPPPLPAIAPARALGLGAIHGCGVAPGSAVDALDLGCGGGALLAEVGAVARGRLVGVDISASACERARERLAPLGPRAEVHQADLLDLDPDLLGRFDLIYCVGVLYVLPPGVRRRALAVVGRCLRPGGVAVLSYYAGSLPRLRACLHEGLRAAVDRNLPRQVQIHLARQHVGQLAAALPPSAPRREVLAQALQITSGGPDSVLFREALGGAFAVLQTSSIETGLRHGGVGFLGYVQPTPFSALPGSRQRALSADAFDLTSGGGYRYAAFGRPATEVRAPSARSPWLRWRSDLARLAPGGACGGTISYSDGRSAAHVSRAGTQALLDELAEGPAPFSELCAGARRRLAAQGLDLDLAEEALVERDLLTLWQSGLAAPEALL